MERLANILRLQSGQLLNRVGQTKLGTVASVLPELAIARVMLQPEGVLSGWMPVATAWSGAGWGIVAHPSPGDQVVIAPVEGDIENSIIIGRIYSDRCRPPDSDVGEFKIVHQSGSCIYLKNDGAVHVKGDLHVDGEVFDSKGSLDRLRTHYNEHRHHSGNNTTDVPVPQD